MRMRKTCQCVKRFKTQNGRRSRENRINTSKNLFTAMEGLFSATVCSHFNILKSPVVNQDQKYMPEKVITELEITMCTVNVFWHISFNLNRILCCDHSFESSRRDDSNEWSQRRNRLRNKEIRF